MELVLLLCLLFSLLFVFVTEDGLEQEATEKDQNSSTAASADTRNEICQTLLLHGRPKPQIHI